MHKSLITLNMLSSLYELVILNNLIVTRTPKWSLNQGNVFPVLMAAYINLTDNGGHADTECGLTSDIHKVIETSHNCLFLAAKWVFIRFGDQDLIQ